MRIYLDVCCLNRPLDNQNNRNVRLETEAILLIIETILLNLGSFVCSDAVSIEVEKIPSLHKRKQIEDIATKIYSDYITYTPEIVKRAEFLNQMGFKYMDSLHVACAEFGNIDVLLTTDKKLLNIAIRNLKKLKVCVKNPVEWFQEYGEHNEDN